MSRHTNPTTWQVMHARTTVCYQKALQSKIKLGLKTMLLIIDSYLLLYNAQEHLNDLETEEKSTGNVNIFADAKTHHILNCKVHDSFKALSPWNPQSSSLKSQPRQQILYQTLSIYMVILYHPATAWIQMCFTKCVCQEFSAGAVTACPWSCLWSWLRSAQEHLVI